MIQNIIGAHTSVAGGLEKAPQRAFELGANSMQIFTKSNRKWFESPIAQEQADAFKKNAEHYSLEKIVAHAAYLINIGSSNPDVEAKSQKSLRDELQRCNQLNIAYLVLHPGSHTGAGEEAGVKKIAENLNKILADYTGITNILLETMAGQGSNVGYTFEQIQSIIKQTNNNKNIGVCFDTCHIFAAGYNIGSKKEYEKTMQQFDDTVGLPLLQAIHLNNSKMPYNSRKDRHEELEKGEIPLEAFKYIMQDSQLNTVPKILETPNPALYKQEIALLKSFT